MMGRKDTRIDAFVVLDSVDLQTCACFCFCSLHFKFLMKCTFFVVLSERKDSTAVNFVKSRNDKFRKMEACISKARERLSQDSR